MKLENFIKDRIKALHKVENYWYDKWVSTGCPKDEKMFLNVAEENINLSYVLKDYAKQTGGL